MGLYTRRLHCPLPLLQRRGDIHTFGTSIPLSESRAQSTIENNTDLNHCTKCTNSVIYNYLLHITVFKLKISRQTEISTRKGLLRSACSTEDGVRYIVAGLPANIRCRAATTSTAGAAYLFSGPPRFFPGFVQGLPTVIPVTDSTSCPVCRPVPGSDTLAVSSTALGISWPISYAFGNHPINTGMPEDIAACSSPQCIHWLPLSEYLVPLVRDLSRKTAAPLSLIFDTTVQSKIYHYAPVSNAYATVHPETSPIISNEEELRGWLISKISHCH